MTLIKTTGTTLMTHAIFAAIPDGKIEALPLPQALYPQSCIASVVQRYESTCIITCIIIGETTMLALTVRPTCQTRARDIVWSFLTELVGLASAAHLQGE